MLRGDADTRVLNRQAQRLARLREGDRNRCLPGL